ncbi:MAG: S16 family serine protease, partial [Planctomycetota bacterium]
FIGTANIMQPVPPALRDRMETIELAGYTRREKIHIATKYLVKRQLTDNGLTAKQADWTEDAISRIITDYTREAGVRELERQIGAVCRSLAAMIATGKARSRRIKPKFVVDVLGPAKYESEGALRTAVPGVATGLAYTPSGGEILFIEAAMYDGSGRMTLTGQIGDVMKESAQAALSLVKSRADRDGIDLDALAKKDIHIHIPAGAIPKDGPSAGGAIFVALHSLLTGKSVRPDVAMTGEITLRGLVMPITVMLPARNRKDIVDVPADAQKELTFVYVTQVDDLIKTAFGDEPSEPKPKRKASRKRTGGKAKSKAR